MRKDESNGTLIKLCTVMYKQSHKNSSSVGVKCAYIHAKILGFHYFEYFPIRIDVVTCEIEDTTGKGKVISEIHLAQGRRPDCVYYLEPSDLAVMHYTLGDHVCDIPIDDISKIKR